MRWISLLPLLCGVGVVAQGGLNRRLAGQWGLPGAALLNAVVLLAVQLGASLAWDALAEGRPATLARVVGSALAFAGAALAVLKG
jgi:transporter family-2 protein